MGILYKILPFVLIFFIFHFLIYRIYPQYQQVIDLVKNLSTLKTEENKLNSLENLIGSLSQNNNIQQILSQREVLDLWLPRERNLEVLLYYLIGVYQIFDLPFPYNNLAFNEGPEKKFKEIIMPVKTINFNVEGKLPLGSIQSLIETIENSSRLMKIKKISLIQDGSFSLEVETYFMENK